MALSSRPNAGIDYGRGQTNIDHGTGIRYGVISFHDVVQAWFDTAKADYGDPTCPSCRNVVVASNDASVPDAEWNTGKDFACLACEACYWSDSVYGDEPISESVDDGEYLAESSSLGIYVIKSPYYTRAIFCSPCCPGAGDLNSPAESGVKTYCFGHDWFEEGKVPYRVFKVSDDSEVFAEGSANE